MNKQVFRKEERVLEGARSAISADLSQGESVNPVFRSLVKEYERLFRQSLKLVTMGDRMQQTLNELNHDLAVSEQKYRGIFENVTEGIYRCDQDGSMVEVNPAMATMFGFASSEEFLASVGNIRQIFCDADDCARYEALLASDKVRRWEVRVCTPEIVTLWAEVSASPICEDCEGKAVGSVVGVLADVTERKRMTEEMCRLARTDSLTGLWNRGYFMELAERELARRRRSGEALSLFIVDADYFKRINDTYGHDVGDKALVEMARILSLSVREVDVVGRFGGEEFVILLPGASRSEACCVADRILRGIRGAVVEVEGARISMSVSIGLTSLEDEDDLDGVIKYADIALYAAKKNGRDRVEVYRRSVCPCTMTDSIPDSITGEGQKQ